MTTTNILKTFDDIAIRLFNTVVFVGLGLVAFGAVAQSIQV